MHIDNNIEVIGVLLVFNWRSSPYHGTYLSTMVPKTREPVSILIPFGYSSTAAIVLMTQNAKSIVPLYVEVLAAPGYSKYI